MKYVLWFTFLLLFSSFYSYSQPLTLVKKDEWGSSVYNDVIKIGDYIYAVDRSGKLDIIDTNKNLSEQLVGQIKFSDSNNADDLNNYNGFLSITLSGKVAFYNLDDPIVPALAFELNIDNANNSGQKVTEGQNHYIVEGNLIYVVKYDEVSGFEILLAQTLDGIVHQDASYDSYQVNIDQGSLFIQQIEVTYPSRIGESNYVIREYDISDLSDIKLLSKASIPVDFSMAGLAYIGQHHFAYSVRSRDKVQIFKAENNEIVLISNLDIDTHSLGVHWQKETNKIRIITSYNWYTYLLESYSEPILESKEYIKKENRIGKIYQFESDNNATVRTQAQAIATVNLSEQDSIKPLYDQSGLTDSITLSENRIVVLKDSNAHVIDIQDDKFKYNNKLVGGYSVYLNHSMGLKDQTIFIDSYNNKISVLESSNNALPEFKYDVDVPTVPTTSFIDASITNEKSRVLKTSLPPKIYWYDVENPLNILIPPLSLDLSAYEIKKNTYIQYIVEMHLINDFLAISGTTVDREMYLLIIKNNGQELEVVDHLFVDSIYWANYFVGNDRLYEMIRYDNNLTEYEISNEGKLTERQTINLTLSESRGEVFTGMSWRNYILTQTHGHLQIYDFSTSELKPIDEIEILPTSSQSVKMGITNKNLVVGNKIQGSLSLFEFNLAPIFNFSKAETDEDIQLIISGIASDQEKDQIEYFIIESTNNGELTLSDDQLSLAYSPNANYFGVDTFKLKATDIHGNFVEQKFEIIVNSINDLPALITDALTTNEDSNIVTTIEAEDVDGDTLSFEIAKEAKFGSATISESGQLTYHPNSDFFGDDVIDILVTDTTQSNVTFKLVISVTPVNDIPVITSSSFNMMEDKILTDVISATDIEEHSISYSLIEGTVQNGVATIEEDGSFIFIPTNNFNGGASFSVIATDSEKGSTEQIIIVDIEAVEDAPVAESASETVAFASLFSGSLAATDPDGDTLTFTVVEGVKNGTLSLSSYGAYTYQANTSFSGADSFIYQVTDTKDNSAQATISFNVQAKPLEKESSSGGGSVNYFLIFLLASIITYRRPKF